MRSEFGLRTAALLVGALALLLGGCGTFSTGLDRGLPLDGSHADAATSLGVWDAAIPTGAAASPVPPSRERHEERGMVASAAASLPEAPGAAFGPVVLELEPTGQTSGLTASAEQAESAPAPLLAQASDADNPPPEPEPAPVIEEYDPWEPFNEKVFSFNYNLDKYVLKPVAKGYNVIVPDRIQRMIGDGFDNLKVLPKLANNILQWNWSGFAVELGRFLINSTLGIGGLFDIAKQEFDLQKTKVDFGQTLGKWGVGPGPYLILPLMTPLTVRDGIGTGVDGAMDPLGYVLPFIWDRFAMKAGETINERSLNLDLFQGFEESTVDLYSAVRNGYLQRRYHLIHGRP